MYAILWLIPALPLSGFLMLALLGRSSERLAAAISLGAVALSAALALAVGGQFLLAPPPGGVYTQTLWCWMRVADFAPAVVLQLDALSLVMILVVTVTAALILVYSIGYMKGDESYKRFFAYMDLFVASMLLLVLARDLLVLYVGWEGVGVCSYLLIGFWYRDAANGRAAQKAFIVTRVGDAAMAVGLLLIFSKLGTLDIPDLLSRAVAQWPSGSAPAVLAAWLLLASAVAKSAQLPLQVWLPDAMAGPTPVSALIHAATMVTAGVYLIARLHVLFALAPEVQAAIAVIGAVTLLLAGVSAATQQDIKRVAAYSTISQVGFMFLALGVGAWSAAICHFVTHAFFKSLLFLCIGVIIQAMDGEHSLFKMHGLRRTLPVTFFACVISALALSGLPPTGGFASKDRILGAVYEAGPGGWLYAAALAGVFLTGLYTFRMLFLAFGDMRESRKDTGGMRRPTASMSAVLVCLAVLSVAAAAPAWPAALGGHAWLPQFLRTVLPDGASTLRAGTERTLSLIALQVALAGAASGWFVAMAGRRMFERLTSSTVGAALHAWWQTGWGFDWFYTRLIVWPTVWMAEINRNDVIDTLTGLCTWTALAGHRLLSRTQTGRLGWYAGCMAAGLVIILALMLWT